MHEILNKIEIDRAFYLHGAAFLQGHKRINSVNKCEETGKCSVLQLLKYSIIKALSKNSTIQKGSDVTYFYKFKFLQALF